MRLINADKFEEYCMKTPEWVADDPFRAYVDGMTQVLGDINAAPTVDAVQVIRCKDCDNWNEWDHAGRRSLGNYRCSCAYWTVEDGPTFYTGEDDFCSHAEKKMTAADIVSLGNCIACGIKEGLKAEGDDTNV